MKDSRDTLLARLGRNEDWIVAGYDFRQIRAAWLHARLNISTTDGV